MNFTWDDIRQWAIDESSGDLEAAEILLEGLFLRPTGDRWIDYPCTPVNVRVFADTGMDGVHYGEIEMDDGPGPIVVIAPTIENYVIVGENLFEFLSLGCLAGFGLLLELPFQPAEFVKRHIQRERDGLNDPKLDRSLQSMRERFQLQSWSNIGERLFELQEIYLDELDLKDKERIEPQE